MDGVRHNPDESRYEMIVGDEVIGFAAYTVDGNTMTVPETRVDPAHGGKGYAGMIVERLLVDAREAGRSVIPQCPYVAGYIRRHPEHLDLVPEAQRERFDL